MGNPQRAATYTAARICGSPGPRDLSKKWVPRNVPRGPFKRTPGSFKSIKSVSLRFSAVPTFLKGFWTARGRPEPQNDRFSIKSLNPHLQGPRCPLKGPRGPLKGPRGPFTGTRGPFKGARGPCSPAGHSRPGVPATVRRNLSAVARGVLFGVWATPVGF